MSKRKRKRLFPRKYSASVMTAPRIDANKAAAYNAQRSKATVGTGNNVEHKQDNSFLEDVPVTLSLKKAVYLHKAEQTYDPFTGKKKHQPMWINRSPRGDALDRKDEVVIVEKGGLIELYKLVQSGRVQGVSQYFEKDIIKREDGYKLSLFFSGNEYLFVIEDPTRNIRKISRTYQDVSTARQRQKTWEIGWVYTEELTKA